MTLGAIFSSQQVTFQMQLYMSKDQVIDIAVEPGLQNPHHSPDQVECPTSKAESNFFFLHLFCAENIIFLVRLYYDLIRFTIYYMLRFVHKSKIQ